MKFISIILLAACMVTASTLPARDTLHTHGEITFLKDPKINQTPSFSISELYNLTTNVFDALMYPNNLVQSEMVNSTIFSTDVLGRVDATRMFAGREVRTT